jgi:putative flavoprotein involved in K+ transport
MSYFLTQASIDHVIFERGEIANSWKFERWDSLRLLTPNWQVRLPGHDYNGDDPDGFMSMRETISFIEQYASEIAAPVHEHTNVTSVSAEDNHYKITTNQSEWICDALVVASGACNLPSIPAIAEQLPPSISQLSPLQYRDPDQLDPGGVLVVGASATGAQIAEEIQRSGRAVTLAVGEHVRMPRRYRDKDIQWWMDATGLLDDKYTEVDDLNRARKLPSPQLIGSPDHKTLDLNSLSDLGVALRGKLAGINEGGAQFSGSLPNVCSLADLKMTRLLNTIDEWVTENDLDANFPAGERYAPTRVEDDPPLTLKLEKEGIKTVLWATGFRPDTSWLDLPVYTRKGAIRHEGGVIDAPGLYLLGSTFLRRRKSSFIHGAEDDARELSGELVNYLASRN